jgi:signal transduction histidine kinase
MGATEAEIAAVIADAAVIEAEIAAGEAAAIDAAGIDERCALSRERRRLQLSALDANMATDQQLNELAELAGGFVHEAKNHISTLGLNLQLLAEDFAEPQTPRERKALERIQRLQHECERLVTVSNDFLRFARGQKPRLAPTRLDDVVAEMVDFLLPTAKQKNITITWYPGGDLPEILLDGDLFKQALLNLLLNAEQAMPEGGEIILQASQEPGWVRLDVIDTGSGIAADDLGKLFKPFHTTKSGGTGLGLPTSRKIVEAHGGTLDVVSEVGLGTKFTIRLPIKSD